MISYHSSLYGADNADNYDDDDDCDQDDDDDDDDGDDDDDQDVWNGRGGSLYGVREPELVRCIPAYSTHTTLQSMMMITPQI